MRGILSLSLEEVFMPDIANLEHDVNQIKVAVVSLQDNQASMREDVAAIKAELKHMATKADVEQMGRLLVMWMVGSMIAVSGIVFAVARYIR